MPKYLTYRQFLAASEGLPILDGNPSATLVNEYIRRAEADVDSFLEFDPRYGGFEPHSVYIQQPFDTDLRKTRIDTFPIPARKVTRYQIQISISNILGTGLFADIQGTEVNINQTDGYVEILPLFALTYSSVPFLLPFGLHPPIAHVEYTSGYYIPIFGESATGVGDNLTFELSRGFLASTYDESSTSQPTTFAPAAPANVYVNGVLKTVGSDYTLDYNEGVITFGTAQASNASVTADYVYQIPDDVREAVVYQTSFLLAQRELNQMGMRALNTVADSGRTMTKISNGSTLCMEAAIRMRKYKVTPLG